jgi:outer membrane protein OmpA-like peptidoglycan-associated protein
MKYWQALPIAVAALIMPAQTQTDTHAGSPPSTRPKSAPHGSEMVENSTKAVNYGRLKGSIDMDFQGTKLMPEATGVADVKSQPGGTTIVARFKKMPPASSFGGEFLTYVLWGVSTEGQATNLGELRIHDGKGKIKATDSLQTFAMVVTAEPYFAVTQPSEAVVMENVVTPEAATQVELIDTQYQLLKLDSYLLDMAPAQAIVMDKKTPFEVYQARNAVRIAQAAGAPTYARVAFEKAQADLVKADTEGASRKSRIMDARASVQSSEDARRIAVHQRNLEQEASNREAAQNQLEAAKTGQDAALQQAAVADAQKDAAISQASAAEAKKKEAINEASAAKANVADLRAALLAEFNAVLQTRATARGLIVNMTGVLFQNGKATLLPAGREKLAKIAGILATHKGLMIEADGFTDSTGTADFNLRLSEKRAENARDYLVSQGVPAATLSCKGFGKDNPIASNSTSSGRQENRRVELVVSGEGITSPLAAGM